AANWGGTAPVAGDDLVFPVGTVGLRNTNDFVSRQFGQITFSGSNYIVQGNALTLTNGLFLFETVPTNAKFTNTFNPPFTLTGTEILCDGSNKTLIVNGNVTLEGQANLDGTSGGHLVVFGAISGNGDLSKGGSGTLTLQGVNANSYTGSTFVDAGTLEL